MSKIIKLGATGDFPEGKLNPNDEGGLQMAVYTKGVNVIIDFGTPVNWLGLPKEDAVAFAQAILSKAEML